MKYSIIVPCYNTASTLEKTVNSIRNCGLKDFEILLIDDGSKDKTPALCDRLAEAAENVRCIHKENGGVSSARNLGLREAVGEYVWFFDSDDLVDSGSMDRAGQIIEEFAPDMLMFGMSFDSYVGKRMYQRLELYYDKEALMTIHDVDSNLSELYRDNMLTPCWNKLIRSSILKDQCVGFDPNLHVMEDLLFSLNALKHCRSIYVFPRVIYRYYQGNGSGDERAAARLKRIPDLPAYMKPFEEALSGHQDILNDLFFMLLRQKISRQSPNEMKETAQTVCASQYAKQCRKTSDIRLIQAFQDGRYDDLFRKIRKNRMKAKIRGRIKRSLPYQIFKGTTVKRVRW
ncbi:MAG: glycosyltransferase family 2 protein [Clostridiales bacterium]|nr:glycosyltransferase family 2 protein [Clostridiales bacterium]